MVEQDLPVLKRKVQDMLAGPNQGCLGLIDVVLPSRNSLNQVQRAMCTSPSNEAAEPVEVLGRSRRPSGLPLRDRVHYTHETYKSCAR